MRENPESTGSKQGSFGMTPEMQQNVATAERKKFTAPEGDKKPTGPTGTMTTKNPEENASVALAEEEAQIKADQEIARVRLERRIAEMEKNLGITITQEDVISYVRQGSLIKEIEIVPGVSAIFGTHTGDDRESMEKDMYKYIETQKTTSDGITNRRALISLAYGLRSYRGRAVDTMEKDQVISLLQKLGVNNIKIMVEAYNAMINIIDTRLSDREFLKKS